VRIRTLSLLLASFLVASTARTQNRRVYEGVVDMKLKPIGTLILLETGGNSLSGWIRLGKFVPIEGGALAENSVEFRAAGNSYKIDEMRERISYSGPDGTGDRRVARLTPITGVFRELTEGAHFGGDNIVTMEVDARMRRFQDDGVSLWKRAGPPFETFRRMEELLQRQITVWVPGQDEQGGNIEVVEEPEGMNIPLKVPKKPKEKK
jgi:hypothetical protein